MGCVVCEEKKKAPQSRQILNSSLAGGEKKMSADEIYDFTQCT